ncbi:MAG TPA: hypothetical protein VFL58_07600 [Gaiellaceae bacterium]|nr:hypothetical protein [Gaiellaceae bacterium]
MKRFLMLVGIGVVAGAMYVAAAPGSRQATGPTARQFAALKKQVASLNKKLTALTKDEKVVRSAAAASVGYIATCFLDSTGNIENLQVNDFGDTTTGFLFGTTGTSGTPRSALDVDTSGAPLAYLQRVTPGCVTGAPAASPASAGPSLRRLQLWAASTR